MLICLLFFCISFEPARLMFADVLVVKLLWRQCFPVAILYFAGEGHLVISHIINKRSLLENVLANPIIQTCPWVDDFLVEGEEREEHAEIEYQEVINCLC